MAAVAARRICITGAGTGIGKQSAIALAKKGHVVFAATYSEEEATEMSEIGKTMNVDLSGIKIDITSEEDREKVIPLKIDVLMNNAGVGYSGSIAEVDLNLIKKNMDVNVFATIAITQVAIKGMIERKRGTVMFVSSIGGRIPFPFVGPYCKFQTPGLFNLRILT